MTTVFAFVAALVLLILFHEWGHYFVARLAGVKVLRFSIGFGKTLWQVRRGPDQTEWAIGAFPLGGYVRMLDEREGPVAPEVAHRAFNRQSLGRRVAIVLAGPLANFLLAFLIYWGLYLMGVPGLKPYVDSPPPASLAAQAGFVAGERIVRVGREEVRTWNEVQLLLIDNALERNAVTLETEDDAGHLTTHRLDLSRLDASDRDAEVLDRIGLKPWDFPIPAVAGRVIHDSPAGRAGIQPGDRIVAVDGKPLASWQALVTLVRENPGKALTFSLERQGRQESVALVPRPERDGRGNTIGKIGVSPNVPRSLTDHFWTTVRDAPLPAMVHAANKTWEVTRLTFKTFGAMLVGQASLKNIGGPIQIADYAGQTARMGLMPYLTFLALISVSLGAINLLPVPLLDGGHLMYYAVELLKGSPVSDRILALTQRVGLFLLTALMAFALYNDIQRLLTN
ncbi:MAG: RIP metalloprotease RseP [Betaproteobacteria bacterium]|nr:RIP metalloprotease RseP [Betaproteobacteria bacterium]MDE2621998.1 RIP metalloprotease RseP [Betaproteobacteria bacterium]